jgi:hypothetical protein
LDALHAAELEIHAELDGDSATALTIDRIGLLALRGPASDDWARCGSSARSPSSTKLLDGVYEFTLTQAVADRTGWDGGTGNARLEIGHGRYAVFHDSQDPDQATAFPGWELTRDPVEVGTVLLRGGQAQFRPETVVHVGAAPTTARFELFRGRLRWRYVSGDEGAIFVLPVTWRKVR